MYPKLVGKSFLKKNCNSYELVCRDKNLSGVVIINKSAFEILQLCNGQNSLKTIESNIHNKYKSDPDSNKFVHTFITDLINNNILKDEYEVAPKVYVGKLLIFALLTADIVTSVKKILII